MKFPIGIQTFESIRRDGYTYVDKTKHVFNLADRGRYYFLSRPRRFGKSLLLSTMEAYFGGRKDLFAGLDIERMETSWTKYPVLHIDLNTGRYDRGEELDEVLNYVLAGWERTYGTEPEETTEALRFSGIIRRAFERTGQRVVILIDECDKPMLQAIDNDKLQDSYRRRLKAFYSALKTQDRYIRFAFLTGVTKFGKVSVFSDLNNLDDISMDVRYADICGMTDDEIHQYFGTAVSNLASANNLTQEEAYRKLAEQYDGYHFTVGGKGIYNPFSLLNALDKMRFNDYWFETGTPSFLVNLLKKSNYRLDNLTKEEVTADVLNSIDACDRNPVPMIYQSGYLTIKGYDERFRLYRLGFPNKEVENGFISYMMPYYLPTDGDGRNFSIYKFIKDVETGNTEGFMKQLTDLFEDGDYQVMGKMELYFQNTMYVIFKMLGFYAEVERRTAVGRIDIVVKTRSQIYIIELKLDGTAASALRQIKDKGYAAPFVKDGRRITLIGVNFSSITRGIDEWTAEELLPS